MKTSEFIQTVNASIYLTTRNINFKSIISQIDTLRKLHVRLQSQCEYLLLDNISFQNNNEREKIKNTAREIKEFANEHNIVVVFEKLGDDYVEFNKRFRDEKKFTSYHYKNIEITNLIVYVEKKKKKYKNKKIEAIASFNLESNFVVLDKNGNDINKIPGVDL